VNDPTALEALKNLRLRRRLAPVKPFNGPILATCPNFLDDKARTELIFWTIEDHQVVFI